MKSITPTGFSRAGSAVYRTARASIMEAKIFQPSADPSSFSLDRSGCGIIPSTFLCSFRIPAMLASDPLGFDSGVISPEGAA